jgi:hypothetical protein
MTLRGSGVPGRINRLALLAVVVVTQIGVFAPAADATTQPVQFGRIQYDSPGSDKERTRA